LYPAYASVLDRGSRPFAQRKFRVNLLEVSLDHKTDPHAARVGLLAGFGEKD
jgi:hypothetical protein